MFTKIDFLLRCSGLRQQIDLLISSPNPAASQQNYNQQKVGQGVTDCLSQTPTLMYLSAPPQLRSPSKTVQAAIWVCGRIHNSGFFHIQWLATSIPNKRSRPFLLLC
jgi:hypothetical protein